MSTKFSSTASETVSAMYATAVPGYECLASLEKLPTNERPLVHQQKPPQRARLSVQCDQYQRQRPLPNGLLSDDRLEVRSVEVWHISQLHSMRHNNAGA